MQENNEEKIMTTTTHNEYDVVITGGRVIDPETVQDNATPEGIAERLSFLAALVCTNWTLPEIPTT
jgi:hypothetical protein